jgi:hypothetical protein
VKTDPKLAKGALCTSCSAQLASLKTDPKLAQGALSWAIADTEAAEKLVKNLKPGAITDSRLAFVEGLIREGKRGQEQINTAVLNRFRKGEDHSEGAQLLMLLDPGTGDPAHIENNIEQLNKQHDVTRLNACLARTLKAAGKTVDLDDSDKILRAGLNTAQGILNSSYSGEVDSFYDLGRKEFLVENSDGIWMSLNETQYKRHLRTQGYSAKPGDRLVSPVEEVLVDVMDTRAVHYAARLAGRQSGFYRENGIRFLVTESLRLPTPAAGEWPTIKAIVTGLLGAGKYGQHQVNTFLGWLRTGLRSLSSGKHQPGQALALAGEANCGKSLLQKIITEMLGGRAAKASLYMSGRSNFNAELFEAEHLMLEDESMVPHMNARRALGDSIKKTVVNALQDCHRKQRTVVNLQPWWRLSISVNDDPDALRVLPPLDDNVRDKITLLRGSRFEMPMPSVTADERQAFWERIKSEVPAFSKYLLTTETPPELLDQRFGVKTWHNPDLVVEIDGLSDEWHLLNLIDRVIFECPTAGTWTGVADELKTELVNTDSARDEARKLLGWLNATGTLLGKAAKKWPDRVKKTRAYKQRRKWSIIPPELETFPTEGGMGGMDEPHTTYTTMHLESLNDETHSISY